jgi:hypothetical protein
MVQVHLGPPRLSGGVAQLGERLPCTQEVIGSIPFTSTRFSDGALGDVDPGLILFGHDL